MSDGVDTEPATVVGKVVGGVVRPREPPPGTGPSEPRSGGTAGSSRALLDDEITRFRGMTFLLLLLCAAATLWFPLLGGDDRLRTAAMIATGCFAVVCLGVRYRAREATATYRIRFRLFAATAVVASVLVQLYIGLFSPAPICVTLGISFIGTSDDPWGRWACIAAIVGYVACTTLVALDVMPDLGLIRGQTMPAARIFGLIMVPFVFAGTLWHAVLTRRTARAAMLQVEAQARVVQQREAQLAEARLDLGHALEVGAGRVGRHTGKRAGEWALGAVIGRGAMGEVYAATHAISGQAAAVKLLAGSPSPEHVARFRREAEIASRLSAPSLVTVHEAGVLDDDTPYLAMELLTGHDLAWHLRRVDRLELDAAVRLCGEVAEGLGAAHDAGIVHRDIKPQNLFRHEPDGAPAAWKILDFGVSKLRGSQSTLTQHRVIGTPGYMSPEQARGEDADERSDVFSLGAVMYRALTGQPPFLGGDTPQVLFDVVYRNPRRPRLLAPSLPDDVDLVLALAIAKRPVDRFARAEEVATALRAAAAGRLDPALRRRALAVLDVLPWGGRAKE